MQWLIEILLTRKEIYIALMLGVIVLIYIIIFIAVKLSIREKSSKSGSSRSKGRKSHVIHPKEESS